MNLGMVPLSFAAGIATFFNPCGFALLPAYVSHYIGKEGGLDMPWSERAWRGLSLGLVTSAGFFTVFSLVGLVLSFFGSRIMRYAPWIAALMGLGLVILGILMLFGRSFSLGWLERAAGAVGKRQAHRENTLIFYYFYGISYAIASVGCALPIFLVVMIQAFMGSLLNGLLQFSVFSYGMALMMIALSLTMSFSKGFIYRHLEPLTLFIQKASALVLIVAGGYLVYYQLIYGRVLDL